MVKIPRYSVVEVGGRRFSNTTLRLLAPVSTVAHMVFAQDELTARCVCMSWMVAEVVGEKSCRACMLWSSSRKLAERERRRTSKLCYVDLRHGESGCFQTESQAFRRGEK